MSLCFAACEQSTPSHNPPVYPEPAPVVTPKQAEAPVAEPPVVAPTPAPAIAPVKPPPRAPKAAPSVFDEDRHPPGKGQWSPPGCRPGSRMACRWVPETDEREQSRVTKKDAN